MFSKTCEYAIRALILIAQKTAEGGRIGIKEIAEGINSPEYFIAKILQNLRKKDFVRSIKGPHGGFFLDEETLNRTLEEVVKEIDGDKILTRCALGLDQCSNEHPCPLHSQFKHVRERLQGIMSNTRIKDLTGQVDAQLAFLKSK